MPGSRIVYQNWIVDIGRDPSLPYDGQESVMESDDTPALRSRVREAVRRLDDEERELIEQLYFLGDTYRQMAERTGRALYRLEALHRRVLRKLRHDLAPFVQNRFQLEDRFIDDAVRRCPICKATNREEIDRAIADRDQLQTWRPVMDRLRAEFDLDIRTPAIMISHERYHMRRKE